MRRDKVVFMWCATRYKLHRPIRAGCVAASPIVIIEKLLNKATSGQQVGGVEVGHLERMVMAMTS